MREAVTNDIRTRRPARLAVLSALITIAACSIARAAPTDDLTFDVIFGEATMTAPTQVTWSPRGDRLSYVWEDESGKGLWLLDAESGDRRRILSIGDQNSDASPTISALARHQWSPDGTRLLLESEGDLHLLTLDGGALDRLTESDSEEEVAHFSPDGGRVAFSRDADLWVLEIASGKETALTDDGRANEILNGKTDWVYWEEIWDRTANGLWWSPDGSRIAFYRFDDRDVPSYPMVNFMPRYPEVEWQRYPKAGETNPTVKVGVVEVAGGATTWMETGDDPDVYLARVAWQPDGRRVAIQRLNRDQNHLELLSCAAADGACKRLVEERSTTWVNVTWDLKFLDDGRFLWTSEASGWRRLALHDAAGRRLREISPAGWNVTAVNGVANGGQSVVFTAHAEGELGALHRTVFEAPLAGGDSRALTATGAWGGAQLSPTGDRLVASESRAAAPGGAIVRKLTGDGAIELPSAVRPGVALERFPERRFLTIPGPEGSKLPAMLMTPPEIDAERRYPAVMYHYGGPASQVVADRWSWRERALWHTMMAQRGYVILMVDNRASNYFGKHGHDRAHRRFGPENLAAQRAGVDYLRSLGYVDAERVGIWGGSGGGYHTLYSLLNSPGTWRAGVAFAPVSDFRFYDTIWSERYLDHPDDNPDGYRDSATTTYAANLEDRLLIVHGTADDNVHPQNTLVMASKLFEAGKQFEMSIHPRQKHGFRGHDARHFYERMTAFFDLHLRR